MANVQVDFQSLFQAIHSPLLVLDHEFNIVAANKIREEITGVSLENSIRRNVFAVFPDNPDDPTANGVANLSASLNRVLQSKAIDQMAIQKYDIQNVKTGLFEERYWSPTNTPILDSSGQVTHILHRVEDVTVEMLGRRREIDLANEVTEQSELRKQMEENEARAREIANNLPIIVWTARPDGYVDWYNDWWYQYLGQPRGTEWNDPLKQPMHPDDIEPTLKIWNACLKSGEFYTLEQRFRRGVPMASTAGIWFARFRFETRTASSRSGSVATPTFTTRKC